MQTEVTVIDHEQLRYENELLKLTVLGGIKLEGLDRLRITLKAEVKDSPRPALRHNLDLYNDTQLEKFIRRASDRLEVGASVIAASLAALTDLLENYRLKQLKDAQNELYKPKPLTEEERREAIAYLKAPQLMKRTMNDIGSSGVIGEEYNRLLMYLIFTSRKREQPLHIVSLGSSGTGKTHLQEKVGELIPEEDKIEITTLSENAFYYFGQRELKHKLILIEDLDGAENVLYPLRELQTKKRISKTIAHKNTKGETHTIHLIVEGPVSVAGCTTQEYIYEDNANRSFLIYLDESKEQDAKVMAYQRKRSAGKIDEEKEKQIKELFKNCQRVLEPVKIINPFAEQLYIPEEVFKPRRTNQHYLQAIEAVTFYHQYQRTWIDEATSEIKYNPTQAQSLSGGGAGGVFIETTLEDIEEANVLMKIILLGKSDELTGACRTYLETLKSYLQQEKQKAFTNREIRKALRINLSTQKRYTLALIDGFYIKRIKGSKARGYEYEITSYEEFTQLKNRITSVLDETLQKLKERFSGSGVVQTLSEPLQYKHSKALNT